MDWKDYSPDRRAHGIRLVSDPPGGAYIRVWVWQLFGGKRWSLAVIREKSRHRADGTEVKPY